jgi:hypothetical protein
VEPIFVFYHPLFFALTTPSLEGGRGVKELQKGFMGAVIASRFAVKLYGWGKISFGKMAWESFFSFASIQDK